MDRGQENWESDSREFLNRIIEVNRIYSNIFIKRLIKTEEELEKE